MALRTDNLHSELLKKAFGTVDEVMLQGVKRHSNSFSASCASKKATWMMKLK
jgi:hypothetical protein